jgi:hypothetical protein
MMSEEMDMQAGVDRAEKFYAALCEYLELSDEKSAENVVKAAFGAVEFSCVVAMQAQITEQDYKNTVNAIWDGINARQGDNINTNEESQSIEVHPE